MRHEKSARVRAARRVDRLVYNRFDAVLPFSDGALFQWMLQLEYERDRLALRANVPLSLKIALYCSPFVRTRQMARRRWPFDLFDLERKKP